MCGIAGHFGRPLGPAVRERMRAALLRRGPDAQHRGGVRRCGNAARRRCAGRGGPRPHAAVDHRSAADADQPMGTDDGALWICYNGEVYGWQDDARRTGRSRRALPHVVGHRIHPARLRGVGHRRPAAAAARHVRDSRSSISARGACMSSATARLEAHRLRAARWRLRVRLDGAQRAAVAAARASAVCRRTAIDAYLAHRYVPAPRTIFTNIARLPNAHRLEFELDTGRLSEHRYWSPRPAPVARPSARCSTRRSSCGWSPIVRSACSCRAASIPARSRAGSRPRGTPDLHSFSAAFPGSSFDESAEAAATARRARFARTSASSCRRRSATISPSIVDDARRAVRRSVVVSDVVSGARHRTPR